MWKSSLRWLIRYQTATTAIHKSSTFYITVICTMHIYMHPIYYICKISYMFLCSPSSRLFNRIVMHSTPDHPDTSTNSKYTYDIFCFSKALYHHYHCIYANKNAHGHIHQTKMSFINCIYIYIYNLNAYRFLHLCFLE